MSPDELSNEQLLGAIESMRAFQDVDWMSESDKKYYAHRAELYEEILKERAESGEYVNH